MKRLRYLLRLALMVAALMVVFANPAWAQDAEEAVGTPVFDLVWIGAVISFFLPLVTSLFKRSSWSKTAKQILALFIAAVAGVVNVGIQSGWEFASVGEFLQLAVFSITQIFVFAAGVYKGLWEDTAVEKGLESVGSPS